MSLIWPKDPNDVVTDQPRLHAFVIGVGEYPHLLNGAGPPAANAFMLDQVSCPVPTALAITSWLLREHANPDCQLGSVELLLSPEQDVETRDGSQVHVDSATKQNIKDSFNAWVKRCSANKDNVALFYFCGHGIMKNNQFLLPEDFGDPAVPKQWENCIDFDGMRVGMRACKAQTQLFFIDACRDTPFDVLMALNPSGDSLIDSTLQDKVETQAVYHATGEGRQAYGPPDEVTYFGDAVLKCLRGVATMNDSGTWVVDTYSLSNALGQVMKQLGTLHKQPLACNPNVNGQAKIHVPPAPQVLSCALCDTDQANIEAEMTLVNGASVKHSAPGEKRPWLELVDMGDWNLQVNFMNFAAQNLQTRLMPPCYVWKVPQ